MIDAKKLEAWKQVDVRTVKKEELVDINDVVIDTNLSKEERVQEYIRQIKNPFCFLCNGVVVKLKFDEEGESFETKLANYLKEL